MVIVRSQLNGTYIYLYTKNTANLPCFFILRLYLNTEINFYRIVTQHIYRERSHPHSSDYIANNKNNWLLLMSQLNLEDLCEEYAPRAFAFLSKSKIWWNAGKYEIQGGKVQEYWRTPRAFAFLSKLKFGEMLAYFKPFRRRSSVFRQAENSRFSWGINI